MKKILIVEDDYNIQEVYKDALVGEGYEVIQANSGDKGYVTIKESRPDLILLDIMFQGGGMNGFDLLEKIKREEEFKNIPVIIITNLDSEQKTAQTIGAADYIVKANATIDEIINKVKAQVGS